MITWIKNRRKYSYKKLYEEVYGDGYYNKGLKREYNFLSSICSMWASEVKRISPLLLEAQDLLKENGLETQSMKASREILEKYEAK